ncbi:hypothetical protein [Clostridium sp.]|uniref:hypothetical protein n=1 Tax=Clostridium sp. TaxID=1506 RepID=UPI0028413C27|nr:hypothetical protein [Clostridium sp.]MDR3596517.1 hypothetical protein [Clostridium sp.]
MKKVFNRKVSKAEQVYLKQLQNRPHDTIFSVVFSKVQDYHNHQPDVGKDKG